MGTRKTAKTCTVDTHKCKPRVGYVTHAHATAASPLRWTEVECEKAILGPADSAQWAPPGAKDLQGFTWRLRSTPSVYGLCNFGHVNRLPYLVERRQAVAGEGRVHTRY